MGKTRKNEYKHEKEQRKQQKHSQKQQKHAKTTTGCKTKLEKKIVWNEREN